MERWVPVESPVASVTWSKTRLLGDTEQRLIDPIEQQRTTFNILTAGGAIDEIYPAKRDVDGGCKVFNVNGENCDGSSYASADGINYAPNMVAAVGWDTLINEGNMNTFCFETNDVNGAGVRNKMVSPRCTL